MKALAIALVVLVAGGLGVTRSAGADAPPSGDYRPWEPLVGGLWTAQQSNAPKGGGWRMEWAYSWALDQPGVRLEGLEYSAGAAIDHVSALIVWDARDQAWHGTGTSAQGITTTSVLHAEGPTLVGELTLAAKDGEVFQAESRLEVSGDAGNYQMSAAAHGTSRILVDARLSRSPGALSASAFGADPATMMLVRANNAFPQAALERLERMGRAVAPPVATSLPKPNYPFLDRVIERQGEVWVGFVVGPAGDVTDAKVLSDSEVRMADAALKGVRRWRFAPGRVDGRPQEFLVTVPVRFQLPRDSLKG